MENQPTQKRERSIAYPAFSLSEVIEFALQIKKSLGKGPYGKGDASRGLGYKGPSGIALAKIAAMVHFGLLARSGNTYQYSDLANRINYPISEEDKNNAIIESVNTPRLYRELILEFSSQALPEQLANILIRKGINSKVSAGAADNFQKSLEFAGLLKNGVVSSVPDLSDREKDGQNDLDKEASPFSFGWPSLDSNAKNTKTIYNFSESGIGWSLTIKSGKPIAANIKKQLVDITEFLENDNNKTD